MKKSLGVLVLGAVWLAVSCADAGAQARKDATGKLEHEVTVAVKLVQVYVTDKNGKPAGGLTADDFEVFDNNQPVPLMHFEKHFAGEERAAGPSAAPALKRKFFLFFDFAFTDARGVLRAKSAGLKFMESALLPTDEVALLTYSAFRGLTVHEYLTTDHAKVRGMIDAFGLKNVTGRAENLANFYYTDALAEAQSDQREATSEERFFAEQARLQTGQALDTGRRQGYVDQARFFLLALNNLAKVLRTVPGYKHIVLFSSGIARQVLFGRTGGAYVGEWTTPEQLAAQLSDYDAAQADAGLRSDFSELLKELKASNCPVYAVDISRVQKETDVDSAQGMNPGVRELDGADSLRQMASQTGGRFYARTVDPDNAMTEIVDSTRSFYVLGYKVDERWDGKFHKVRVRVKQKGYDVYAPGGYFSPKPFKEYTSFEKLLHLIELGLTDDPRPFIPVEMPAVSLNLVERGWPAVLTFARASGGDMVDVFGRRTEAYLLLFNAAGELVFIKKFKVAVTEKDRSGKEAFLTSFLVPVKQGSYTCVLIMRNMDTGMSAKGRAAIRVPGELPAAPFLDPPVLLVLDNRALEIVAAREPTLAAIYGYDGATYSAAAGVVPAGTQRLFAAVRLNHPAGGDEGLEVRASLVSSATGESRALPVSILQKAREGQMVRLLLELGTGELSAGSHTLTFTVAVPAAAQPAETSVAFEVR
jgi:VWFA-related protein